MAWTTPKTDFNPGDVLTAANMNAIGENLDAVARVLANGSLTTSAITISSAASYASIEIILTVRSNAAAVNDVMAIRFNGDTGSNYDRQFTYMSTILNADQAVGQTAGRVGLITGNSSTADFTSSYKVVIPDPGSGLYKTAIVTGGFTQTGGVFTSSAWNQWRSTAAITSVTFGLGTGTGYVAGSEYTIIGYPFIT